MTYTTEGSVSDGVLVRRAEARLDMMREALLVASENPAIQSLYDAACQEYWGLSDKIETKRGIHKGDDSPCRAVREGRAWYDWLQTANGSRYLNVAKGQ
jgi:hypothetical protein